MTKVTQPVSIYMSMTDKFFLVQGASLYIHLYLVVDPELDLSFLFDNPEYHYQVNRTPVTFTVKELSRHTHTHT